jgi:hypothetical protein
MNMAKFSKRLHIRQIALAWAPNEGTRTHKAFFVMKNRPDADARYNASKKAAAIKCLFSMLCRNRRQRFGMSLP